MFYSVCTRENLKWHQVVMEMKSNNQFPSGKNLKHFLKIPTPFFGYPFFNAFFTLNLFCFMLTWCYNIDPCLVCVTPLLSYIYFLNVNFTYFDFKNNIDGICYICASLNFSTLTWIQCGVDENCIFFLILLETFAYIFWDFCINVHAIQVKWSFWY